MQAEYFLPNLGKRESCRSIACMPDGMKYLIYIKLSLLAFPGKALTGQYRENLPASPAEALQLHWQLSQNPANFVCATDEFGGVPGKSGQTGPECLHTQVGLLGLSHSTSGPGFYHYSDRWPSFSPRVYVRMLCCS